MHAPLSRRFRLSRTLLATAVAASLASVLTLNAQGGRKFHHGEVPEPDEIAEAEIGRAHV